MEELEVDEKEAEELSQAVIRSGDVGRWSNCDVGQFDLLELSLALERGGHHATTPFPRNDAINSTVGLWLGDITRLAMDGIVHVTNESLSDKSEMTSRIYEKAGASLAKQIRKEVKVCKTGEAKLTLGYNLPSSHIVHTVGPRYTVRYRTAAESALFSSYRSSLQLAQENDIKSLAVCCVHALSKGYPAEPGAHIALRTVRRWLERHVDVWELVLFVIETKEELDVYSRLMPQYFPRNEDEEAYSAATLPATVGTETGEPQVEGRQIRILDKPIVASAISPDFESTVDITEQFQFSVRVGAHGFSQMTENPDGRTRKRLKNASSPSSIKQSATERYFRLLQRAKKTDLSSLATLHCLECGGTDRVGRPVVQIVGKHFPAGTTDFEQALLFLIKQLDDVVRREYVVVYFHTATDASNIPRWQQLRDAYTILDDRYKKNLKAFYIVHPTFWSKVLTWWFCAFAASDIRGSVVRIKTLRDLFTRVRPDQLNIPQFVLDHDAQLTGISAVHQSLSAEENNNSPESTEPLSPQDL